MVRREGRAWVGGIVLQGLKLADIDDILDLFVDAFHSVRNVEFLRLKRWNGV